MTYEEPSTEPGLQPVDEVPPYPTGMYEEEPQNPWRWVLGVLFVVALIVLIAYSVVQGMSLTDGIPTPVSDPGKGIVRHS